MTDTDKRAPISGPVSAAIAALNDRLRTTGTGGLIVVSRGLVAHGKTHVALALAAVASFEAFNTDNDPYGERDAAMLEVGPDTIMFKIDYYDTSLSAHSSNPADPSVTERVMTIMLAEEY